MSVSQDRQPSLPEQIGSNLLRTIPLRDLTIAGLFIVATFVGFALGFAASGFLPGRYAYLSAYLPFIGGVAAAAILLVLLKPKWVFLTSVVFCVTYPDAFNEIFVPLGFMKLYIQDVFLAFNMSYILLRLIFGKATHRKIPFNKFVFLYLALGAFSAFNGLVLNGNPYDKVFGDVRRAFAYFLSYFFVLYTIDNEAERVRFRNLLLVACAAVIGKGIFQALTGQFYYRRLGDAAHILSHYELTFLSFGVFYMLARVFFEAKPRFWPLAYAFAGIITTIVGNYRASWLGLAAGLFLLFLFLPMKRRLQLTGIIAGLMVLTALTIYALWDVEVIEHSTLGQEIMAKADVRNTTLDINVVWRFDSYRATLEYWRQHPWLGCGLGTIVDFATITTRGTPYLALDHRVHNSFLWLFMTQGLIGFPIAMSLHIAFLVYTLRYVRTSTWPEGKATVLACAAYAVSMLTSAGFEIFLEAGAPITVYSAVLGLGVLTIDEAKKREAQRAEPNAQQVSAAL